MSTDNNRDNKDNLNQTNPNPNQGNFDNPQNLNPSSPAGGNPKRPIPFKLLAAIFLVTLLFNIVVMNRGSDGQEIEYNQFLELIDSGNLEQVQINADTAEISLKPNADLNQVENILYPQGRDENAPNQPVPATDSVYTTTLVEDSTLVDRIQNNGITFLQVSNYAGFSATGFILSWIRILLMMWVLPFFVMYLLYSLWSFLRKKLSS